MRDQTISCATCKGKCRTFRALRSNLTFVRSSNALAAGIESSSGHLLVVYDNGYAYVYESAGTNELAELLAAETAGTYLKEAGLTGTCRRVEDITSDVLEESCYFCWRCDQIIDAPEEDWSGGPLVCEHGHPVSEGHAVDRCVVCTCAVLG